jgi:hypothetical protein
VVEETAEGCQNGKMAKKTGYDALMDKVCVEWGFCGGIDDQGNPSHVDFYIPDSGPVTAEQFTDWVFLADGMDPEEDLSKWQPHKDRIISAFVSLMGSEIVDASELKWSLD